MAKAPTATVLEGRAQKPVAQDSAAASDDCSHQWMHLFRIIDRDLGGYIAGWYTVEMCFACGDKRAGEAKTLTRKESRALGRGVGWIG